MEGLFNLARPIRQPGIFLSHPPIATTPSKDWHPTTVSIESAITSRETNEYLIPRVPIDIPSEIVIVLNKTDLSSFSSTDSHTKLAKSLMCILHGVTIDHVDATPT